MSDYLPVTAEERRSMLDAVKATSADELFADVPKTLRAAPLDLPDGKSQQETEEIMRGLAAKNKVYPIVLRGAGSYKHYIPPIVTMLANRAEFVTAYTPYQAEISQGILQATFEYQSIICRLTGMDVSNASVYSGATAAAEAVLMCADKRRKKAVVAGNARPDVIKVIETYAYPKGIEVIKVGANNGVIDKNALYALLDAETACFYIEIPSYFGTLQDMEGIAEAVHSVGAKLIIGANPIAQVLLKTPAELGADIAVGEGQPLGLPMNFGGPYLGYMACKTAEMRKLPGRIVGETEDHSGNKTYVLTLQAREQHIRRDKASSNICSNEAHCALTAAIYTSSLGKEGLRDVANACLTMAHYLADKLDTVCGLKPAFTSEFFHEFVTVKKGASDKILSALDKEGVLGGLKLDDDKLLWCVTEAVKKADLDRVTDIIRSVL